MREIKFRGKRKDNGEWAYGNLITKKDGDTKYYILNMKLKSDITYLREIIP